MRAFQRAVAALLIALTTSCAPALLARSRPDARWFPEPRAGTVAFWGHSCVYMDLDGFGIITDPVFGARYSPFHGRRIPAPPFESFDQTRLVLISHAHQDHLQPSTLKRFGPNTTILCPVPSEKHVRGLGPKVRVMRPGDVVSFPGGSVTAVMANHPGGRWQRRARLDGGALGYVIRTPKRTLYYSGDTEYFTGFDSIRVAHHPDVAILNVNVHLPPADAIRAEAALGYPRVIAVHMGAYASPMGKPNSRWHEEFLGLAGELGVPLRVGESIAWDSIRAAPTPASHLTQMAPLASGGISAISHFTQVEPGLYRGARPGTRGLRRLHEAGFRSVISLIHDNEERREAERLGLHYAEIPLHANVFGSSEPTEAQIRRFIELAGDSALRPAYFHCRHGRDRTGVMAALYRTRAQGWTRESALREMRALGASRFYKDLYRPLDRWAIAPRVP